jgi:hypothetical protein
MASSRYSCKDRRTDADRGRDKPHLADKRPGEVRCHTGGLLGEAGDRRREGVDGVAGIRALGAEADGRPALGAE